MGWITGSDLHGRRVHFQFGAASGARAFLAVWLGQRVVVAMMANLGHAKLPFNRLMSTANPFFSGPQPDQVAATLALVAIAVQLWRRHHRQGTPTAVSPVAPGRGWKDGSDACYRVLSAMKTNSTATLRLTKRG
jgi:hypothetical protein